MQFIARGGAGIFNESATYDYGRFVFYSGDLFKDIFAEISQFRPKINTIDLDGNLFPDHYWWLAQYSWFGFREHAGPPTLPKRLRRDRVVLHQTSDHKLAPPGEVQSRSVDWDRWEIGNQDEMELWIAGKWGGAAPPPPPPPTEKHVVVTANLNVRDEPEGKDIGTLKEGTDVTVVEEMGDWLKLKEGWIHKGYTKEM